MTLFGVFARAAARRRRALFISLGLLTAFGSPIKSAGDCLISGPATICTSQTNSYTVAPGFSDGIPSYSWLITNATTDAVFVGDPSSASVQILATTNGIFTLQCTVTAGTNSETCSTQIG